MKDDKLKYMNELYENGIANEIRKYNVEKKMTPKEMFNERKKVCLIDNGVELEEELNNIEEEGNMSEEIKEEEISKNNADENINNRKHKSYSNKLYKSQIEFNHNIISLQHFNNQSMTTKNKKVYKYEPQDYNYLNDNYQVNLPTEEEIKQSKIYQNNVPEYQVSKEDGDQPGVIIDNPAYSNYGANPAPAVTYTAQGNNNLIPNQMNQNMNINTINNINYNIQYVPPNNPQMINNNVQNNYPPQPGQEGYIFPQMPTQGYQPPQAKQ